MQLAVVVMPIDEDVDVLHDDGVDDQLNCPWSVPGSYDGTVMNAQDGTEQ